MRSIRILKKGLRFLESTAPNLSRQYAIQTNNGQFSGYLPRKERELRISETIQIMRLADVKTGAYEKPVLYEIGASDIKDTENYSDANAFAAISVQPPYPVQPSSSPQPYSLRNANISVPAVEKPAADVHPAAERAAGLVPLFYVSKEVKNNDINGLLRTSYTRTVGLYVTPVGWYGVFNLGDGLCEWNTASEAKSCEQMRMTCKVNGWLDGSRIMERNSIIIARNTDVAVRMMRVTDEAAGGVRFRADGKSTRNRYIRFDETYDTSFFVPANENGARMLRILAAPNFRDRILEACLDDDIRLDPMKATVIADGRNAEGEYFYLFFDSELRRLRGFRDSMKIRNIPLSKCLVACFPWQEPIVREYLGEEARIKTIGMDAIEKAVFENT